MKIKDRIVELRRVKGSDLLPNPKNWRTHPEPQANALRGVLAEVGFAGAAIARETEEGLLLIDGHLRAEVAPDQELPVLVLDVDEEEADKLLATFDPLGALAGTDSEKLSALAADVAFDNEALQALLGDLCPPPQEELEDVEAQLDRAEELQETWGTEPGQLWIFGERHRLLCGDSTQEADVARLLDGDEPLLMVTDPPYGVNYDPNWRNEAAEKGQLAYAARRVGEVENDDRADWTDTYMLFPGDVIYAWSPAGDLIVETGSALIKAGFQIRNQIIWSKSNFPISRGHYTYRHEPCWYAVKKGRKSHWIGDHSASTVWEINLDKNVEGGHSTQKPLECMARPIRNHEGDVYEPFLGSGTTMVAAHQLDRTCYAMEIAPKYVAVAIQRMKDLGVEPRLAEQE